MVFCGLNLTWTDKRWAGLSVGLVTLSALLCVSPPRPISNELRHGLGFLATGTGFVAYVAVTLAVLEPVDERSTVAEAPSGTSPPPEGA